jgi:murein DD-endopeptidase MepM/ murein hydrolase activator NlpD
MFYKTETAQLRLSTMNSNVHLAVPSSHAPRRPWTFAVAMHAIAMVLLGPVNASGADPVSASTQESWVPPLAGATQAEIVRPFIAPQAPWSAAHRGVDIQATSDQVVAPAEGEVTFVGTVVDRPVLTIRHSNGLLSSFEPVESDLELGDRVEQGDVVGTLSPEADHCPVACVHWGVRKPDAWAIGSTVRDLYLDPGFLLGWTEPSVLWPIHSDPEP